VGAGGAGATILDAEHTASVIRCSATVGGGVRGFTIRGGNGSQGGGVDIVAGDVEVDHVVFVRNGASIGGAGLSARNAAAPWVHHCVFDSSFSTSASDVHAIRLNQTVGGIVEHNLITHSDGNGLLTVEHASTTVRDNIFCRNGVPSPPRGRGICWLSDQPARIAYNLFFENQVAALLWQGGGGDFSATAANDYDANDGVHHNLEADPQFMDAAAGDWRLAAGSPAIDAGDPAAPHDSDGTVADIGPYARLQPLGVPSHDAAVAWAVAPNPMRDGADVRFVVPMAAPVRIDVLDVAGRLVRTLARATFAAGPQRAAWDGRDAAGATVAPGVYRVRVRVGAVERALTVVRLR